MQLVLLILVAVMAPRVAPLVVSAPASEQIATDQLASNSTPTPGDVSAHGETNPKQTDAIVTSSETSRTSSHAIGSGLMDESAALVQSAAEASKNSYRVWNLQREAMYKWGKKADMFVWVSVFVFSILPRYLTCIPFYFPQTIRSLQYNKRNYPECTDMVIGTGPVAVISRILTWGLKLLFQIAIIYMICTTGEA